MHEPGPGHRLDHRPDRLAVVAHLLDQVPQAIAIRRRRELLDELARLGDHAHIQPPATEIKTSMQHGPSFGERLTKRRRTARYRQPPSAPAIRMAGSRGGNRRAPDQRCSTQSAGPLRPGRLAAPAGLEGSFIAFQGGHEMSGESSYRYPAPRDPLVANMRKLDQTSRPMRARSRRRGVRRARVPLRSGPLSATRMPTAAPVMIHGRAVSRL